MRKLGKSRRTFFEAIVGALLPLPAIAGIFAGP